jgi:hypothetical protein
MTIDQITAIAQGIVEHMSDTGAGYCDVPSNSKPGVTHRVYFNTKLYSVSCTCEAGTFGQDCGHRVAVDRHFDSRRAAKGILVHVGKPVYTDESDDPFINANLRRSILGEDMPVHVEDDLRYEGCDFCGRNHKSWNCPF